MSRKGVDSTRSPLDLWARLSTKKTDMLEDFVVVVVLVVLVLLLLVDLRNRVVFFVVVLLTCATSPFKNDTILTTYLLPVLVPVPVLLLPMTREIPRSRVVVVPRRYKYNLMYFKKYSPVLPF
jgi:cell division protein FtsW (lipid II flippase)